MLGLSRFAQAALIGAILFAAVIVVAVLAGQAVPQTLGAPAPAPPATSIVDPAAQSGIEILSPAVPAADRPPSTVIAPLLSDPTPSGASATGELAPGTPAAMLLAAGSEVTTSSLTVSDDTVFASVAATTDLDPATVLAAYPAALDNYGLSGTPAVAAAGWSVQSFYRGSDSITVTVTADGTGSKYSLRGVFRLND